MRKTSIYSYRGLYPCVLFARGKLSVSAYETNVYLLKNECIICNFINQ